MNEILIASSVLILLLTALRAVFRKTVPARVQYALWGVVLLRLLLPVSLPAMDFSVLTVTEPVQQTVSANLESRQIYVPVAREPLERHPAAPDADPEHAIAPGQPSIWVIETDETAVQYRRMTSADVLRYVWYGGMAVVAVWMLASNLSFYRKLRKVRIPYSVPECRYPVYVVESGLPSPCLFGLFRPAVYLTPAAAEPEKLRHVLAHEETHARHLDPLWALLRCVCLTVYWFDPLVWLAAALSKADGELACDEGTLKRLGEEERIPYGRTLLSLVPVRRPGNPMLSATTMTAGKRQLKDRITRIAQNRQTVAIAVFLLLSAAALCCAVTFSGARETDPGAATVEVVPLTGAELTYFNEEYFNNHFHSIRNQFLSSTYETPEDIDLYELFYCGSFTPGVIGDEELAIVGSFDSQGQEICPTVKITAEAMDEVLLEYTGLHLTETNQVNLDRFVWLAEYDAYYDTHGDTNYRSSVTFSAGERVGDVIQLYYDDAFLGGGWKCLRLRETEDGYHFLSNLPCDAPMVATSYPDGEPWLVIPLGDLRPYAPEAVTAERHSNDCAERLDGWSVGSGVTVRSYRSTDGHTYVAVERGGRAVSGAMEDWEADCFLTLPEGEDGELFFFSHLFGHSGLTVRYTGQLRENVYNTITDYYTFDEAGTPALLARAYGAVLEADLDGDGNKELAASAGDTAQLFFARDGRIYQADLSAVLEEAWPELRFAGFGNWDGAGRCLSLTGSVPFPGHGNASAATAFRNLYFDGENLLLYKRTYGDALTEGVPESVARAAAEAAEDAYAASKQGTEGYLADQNWDGCRLSCLAREAVYTDFPGLTVEVYGFSYQFHSPTPWEVITAGGSFVDEDGWYGGFWTEDSLWLLRVTDNRGGEQLVRDNGILPQERADSVFFHANVGWLLVRSGLLIYEDLSAQDLFYLFYCNAWSFLNDLGQQPEAVQQEVLDRLTGYARSDAEAEADFQNEMSSLFFNTRSLTEEGAAAYRRLVAITNQWDVPSRVATTVENVVRDRFYEDSADPSRFGAEAQLAGFRVTDVEKTVTYSGEYVDLLGSEVAVYRVSYEYLAEDPMAVEIAGGQSMDGDGWFTPGDGSWLYVFFRVNGDGSQTYLYNASMDDCIPGDEVFTQRMLAALGITQEEPEPEIDPDTLPLAEEPTVKLTQYNSYQEAYDSIDWNHENIFYLDRELTADTCTVVSWGYGGIPHGPAATLDVIYPDGTRARLPLPSRHPWGPADSPETLELSEDGSTLTYTAHFDENLLNDDRTAVIHRAGTYHYTYDVAARTVSLTITKD
ncbi:M56 family metallopeptidase [Dysosmobacter sp.]|uniref:M56 family metallopeptidase n=1 Tax=Dysosmobacter sp. TaxID=2591382 RepID=UPI002A906E46|nr:M56 family metallopeptidase [Dysosmobacter sp.]MDY3280966.1 M56 family metallopeptidase [Dysosmobacter sp.]